MKSGHSFGRGYSIKGQTPVLKKSGSRFSCNVISMLSNMGTMRFMTFKENLTKKVFGRVQKMLKSYDEAKFMYIDE